MKAWLFGDGMIENGKLKYRSFARQSVLSAMATSQTPTLMRVELSEDGSCEVLKAKNVSVEIREWMCWCVRSVLEVHRAHHRYLLPSCLHACVGSFDNWPVFAAGACTIPANVALLGSGVFLDDEAALIAELDRRMERLFEEVL
jgi:hypothetical protein